MPDDELVDTTYADHDGGEEYKRLLETAEATKTCPFCHLPPENKVICRGDAWLLMECRWPYENSDGHLIILPYRHIVDDDDISPEDWVEIQRLKRVAKEKYPTVKIGGGLVLRFGTNSGVTVRHLHFHLIAAITNPATGKVFPGKHVNFPIG